MEMTNSNAINMIGRVKVEVRDEAGRTVFVQTSPNLVVTTGKNFIASRIKDGTSTAMTHMAIGDGDSAAPGTATSPAAADTGLGDELARVAITSTTVTNNEVEYVATFAPGTPASAAAIVEAGLFNASTGGTMLCRTTFAVVNKGTSDTMTVTWTVTVS